MEMRPVNRTEFGDFRSILAITVGKNRYCDRKISAYILGGAWRKYVFCAAYLEKARFCNHIPGVEIRPNDLASPQTACLTDELALKSRSERPCICAAPIYAFAEKGLP